MITSFCRHQFGAEYIGMAEQDGAWFLFGRCHVCRSFLADQRPAGALLATPLAISSAEAEKLAAELAGW